MATRGFFSAFQKTAAPYAVAVLATGVALLVHWPLSAFLGDSLPYITLFPAVAFSAWYCGIGPSIATTLLCVAGAKFWFIAPTHSFRILDAPELVGMLAFLVSSAVIVAIAHANRGREQTLRRAQEELEDRIKQRTSELDTANQSLRDLTARLLQLQDEERRRIARELHDSVGQTLAALAMNLSTVGTDIERLSKTALAVADSATLVQEMSKEVRTISHLLHPPLLDETGLSSALQWYIEGFAQRSKIQVDLEFPGDFGRLSRELETTIFRTVQECLTNIHRHSESPSAAIRISRFDSQVRLEIADRGKGIPTEKQEETASAGTPGIGIRGMRERIRQLGGTMEIHSGKHGTAVIAQLPVSASSMSADAA